MHPEKAQAVCPAPGSWIEDNGGDFELPDELLLDAAEVQKGMKGLQIGDKQ